MLGMGAQEIAIIAIVLIIVVGPDDLPGMLRTVGRWIGSIQSLARDFRRQIDTMADEAGLAEEKKLFDQARAFNPKKLAQEALDPGGHIAKDLSETQKAADEVSLALRTQDLKQKVLQPAPAESPANSSTKSPTKSSAGALETPAPMPTSVKEPAQAPAQQPPEKPAQQKGAS